MSEENVETCQRSVDLFNRRDLEAWLEDLDPEVEFHLALMAMFGGTATVFRGHEGARKYLRDLDEVFAEFQIVEISEIRDVGERVVAVGQLHGRGRESGAEVESPIGYVVEFNNGKIIRVDDFFDPKDAFVAAGLSE
jgi:ketosteroid isomerase-like protein